MVHYAPHMSAYKVHLIHMFMGTEGTEEENHVKFHCCPTYRK